ncbi:MAG: hypothetical protein ACI9OD_000244 [Limisphaerales bacterium]|jgi:hypothetical protein
MPTVAARNMVRHTTLFVILIGLVGMCPAIAAVDFAHEIVPVLRKHCGKCHLGDKRKGGLSLNTREALLEGGENGPVVIPGNSRRSHLYELLITDDEDDRMPPEGDGLAKKELELIRNWIEGGVAWESGFAFDEPGYEPPLQPRRPKLPAARDGRNNPVDRILDGYLAAGKASRAESVNDGTFARRLHLDLLGILPSPERLAKFIADKSPDKRDALIKEVLSLDIQYAEHWLTFWNDLLRNDYSGTGFITGGRKQITDWLYRSLIDNKPFDQFVRELISPNADSEGFTKGIKWRGNVNSSQTLEIQFAQNVSQVFLGINLKCASCHDSFIDRWKLSESYNFAAIYGTEKLEIHRCDKPTGKFAEAKWLFPEIGDIDPAAPQPERLKQLAKLMTHTDNGRFTRTIVNRIWQRLMGRGIVHPVDAMQVEPWNADLLDHLAVHLADNGFDLKQTMELIVSSQAYQARTVVRKSEDASFVYRGPIARRMTAEQFLDSIWQVTSAGPVVPDAQVLRVSTKTDSTDASQMTPVGKWIWSYAKASQSVPKAGERITVRKQFLLKASPKSAAAIITCDNEYTLFVNGKKVKEDKFWPTVEAVPLESQLRAGKNEILIVARNAGDTPNAAAVYFETRIKTAEGKELAIGTDETWEWTKAAPDARGRWKKPATDWQPAVPVANQSFLPGTVRRSIRAKLAQINSATDVFVRASLVKLDFLMRSLGRPMREQVVTTRPSELTTLQAIDLQNGQILADTMQRGAKNVAGRKMKPQRLISWLYDSALSRQPTPGERKVATEIVTEAEGTQGIEDLLWAVFMLPEFQLIR